MKEAREKYLGRRAEQKKGTRAKVIAAAKAVFEREGYEAATTRVIADEAKLSTGAIFTTFKGKAELYQAVYGHPPVDPELGRRALILLRRLANGTADVGDVDAAQCMANDFVEVEG